MGFRKWWGDFENLEIKGVPFQVRPPNYSRGGWILIKDMHSPGFEKYYVSKKVAYGGLLFFVFCIFDESIFKKFSPAAGV